MDRITRGKAVALLEAARRREAVPVERARQFARAVLERDPIWRLALVVLDGGLFTGARLMELAAAVVQREHAGDRHGGAENAPGELLELHAAGEATRT